MRVPDAKRLILPGGGDQPGAVGTDRNRHAILLAHREGGHVPARSRVVDNGRRDAGVRLSGRHPEAADESCAVGREREAEGDRLGLNRREDATRGSVQHHDVAPAVFAWRGGVGRPHRPDGDAVAGTRDGNGLRSSLLTPRLASGLA